MPFSFDYVLLIVAIFSLFSGLYFGFFNELRRTLSNLAGLLIALALMQRIKDLIGPAGDVLGKVVNFIFVKLSPNLSTKLAIGIIIFIVVRIIVFLLVGLFKQRGIKAFMKERSTASYIFGAILGIINAYIVGLVYYLLFSMATTISTDSIAFKIYSIVPIIRNLIIDINGLATILCLLI